MAPTGLTISNWSTDMPARVDLGGWTVTDDLTNPSQFVFPEGTRIPALGYLIVWCDSRRNSPDCTPVSDSSAKAKPWACSLRAHGIATRGSGDLRTAIARPRRGTRVPLTALGARDSVPAAANTPVDLGNAGSVRINEWLAIADNTADWFELFNPDSRPVNLGGLIVSDGRTTANCLPDPGRGRGASWKLSADGVPKPIDDHVTFRLSGGVEILLRRGDRVWWIGSSIRASTRRFPGPCSGWR